MLGDGNPAKIRMFNKVGLERSGFTKEQMAAVKFIFKAFYRFSDKHATGLYSYELLKSLGGQ